MLLAIWDDGVWQNAAAVTAIAFGAYLLVMWIAALVWTYRDAQTRTRDPFTQAVSVLMVLVFNLPGLLLYLILRPKSTIADTYDRQLEAEALLHELQEQATCPACRRKVDDDFLTCPYCRTALRVPCATCARPMSSSWVLCPFCGADRPLPTPMARPASAAEMSLTQPSTPPPARRRPSTARYTPPAGAPAPSPGADAAPDILS